MKKIIGLVGIVVLCFNLSSCFDSLMNETKKSQRVPFRGELKAGFLKVGIFTGGTWYTNIATCSLLPDDRTCNVTFENVTIDPDIVLLEFHTKKTLDVGTAISIAPQQNWLMNDKTILKEHGWTLCAFYEKTNKFGEKTLGFPKNCTITFTRNGSPLSSIASPMELIKSDGKTPVPATQLISSNNFAVMAY